MFGSLHKKLMLIMLLLITSLMVVAGTFLTARVTSFYVNAFYKQLDSVFGVDQREFVLDLRRAAGESNGAEHLREMLEANAGPLGIDYRTRNYFVLDGVTGDYLTGSANADALPREQSPNLLTARLAVARGDSGAVGEDSYFSAGYMDAAIPILPIDHTDSAQGLIIYILDNQEILSGLNRELLPIILQALVVGLLIAALISFLLAKAMAGPLERLTVGVGDVAAGKFGRTLPVESNDEIGILTGRFNEMAGVLHDTLAAVENERNKLDTLFLHMTDGVVAFDMGGAVIHCNPAATEMLGRAIALGSRYAELFGDVFSFRDVLALQRPNYAERELTAGERTLELLLAPFSDRELGGVLAVIHDVTEQHRNEERRREFVANVSHELRTPLTNVRSYAETLRDAEGSIPPDTTNNFLDIIISETDRMTHIVQDLLILSRLDAGNTDLAFRPFPFREAIDSVVRANALNAQTRRQELSWRPEGELPTVEGDRSRLEQVMMNIIGNAIKYTPEGGHIRITAGVNIPDGDPATGTGYQHPDRETVSTDGNYAYRKGVNTGGNYADGEAVNAGGNYADGEAVSVWMDVWDDGIGIPEASRSRIFERFYRVDKARSRESGGTGLGLSIAWEIVQRHHGALTLPPHDGPGTTIRLTLPVRQNPAGRIERKAG